MALPIQFFTAIFCLILIGCPATNTKDERSYRDRVGIRTRFGAYASEHYSEGSRYGSPRNRTFQYPDYSFYGAGVPYHNSSNGRQSDRYDRTYGSPTRDLNSHYSFKNLSYSRNYYNDNDGNSYVYGNGNNGRGTYRLPNRDRNSAYSYKNLTFAPNHYNDDSEGDSYNRATFKNNSHAYGPVRSLYKAPLYPPYDTSPLTCPKCPDCPPTCPISTTTAATPTPIPANDEESSSASPGSTNSDGLLSLTSGCDLQPASNLCYLKKQSTPFRCTVDECEATGRANPTSGIKIFAPADFTISRCTFRKTDTFLFTYDVCQLPKANVNDYKDLSKDPFKSFVCAGINSNCFNAMKTRIVVNNLKDCGTSIGSSLTPIELQCTIKLAENNNVFDSASVNVTVLPDCRC